MRSGSGMAIGAADLERCEDVPVQRVVGQAREQREAVVRAEAEALHVPRDEVRQRPVPAEDALRRAGRARGEGDVGDVVRTAAATGTVARGRRRLVLPAVQVTIGQRCSGSQAAISWGSSPAAGMVRRAPAARAQHRRQPWARDRPGRASRSRHRRSDGDEALDERRAAVRPERHEVAAAGLRAPGPPSLAARRALRRPARHRSSAAARSTTASRSGAVAASAAKRSCTAQRQPASSGRPGSGSTARARGGHQVVVPDRRTGSASRLSQHGLELLRHAARCGPGRRGRRSRPNGCRCGRPRRRRRRRRASGRTSTATSPAVPESSMASPPCRCSVPGKLSTFKKTWKIGVCARSRGGTSSSRSFSNGRSWCAKAPSAASRRAPRAPRSSAGPTGRDAAPAS